MSTLPWYLAALGVGQPSYPERNKPRHCRSLYYSVLLPSCEVLRHFLYFLSAAKGGGRTLWCLTELECPEKWNQIPECKPRSEYELGHAATHRLCDVSVGELILY